MNLVQERFSSIKDFTFHSFRRSSVPTAADGATAQQCNNDYISTSKKTINNMTGPLKPETVTSSSPLASSSADVSSDPIGFLSQQLPQSL